MTALDDLCPIPFHAAPDAVRARILSRLADTELVVALTAEPADDRADIRVFDLSGTRTALACDTEERLSAFQGAAVAYAAMPGRILAGILSQDGIHLLINPGEASEMLLEPETLTWLGQALDIAPEAEADKPRPSLFAPDSDVVATLLEPLSQRLPDMAGLAKSAALMAAAWPDGRRGHLLLLRGTDEKHRDALAKSLAELLAFLPEVKDGVDVAFSDLLLPQGALVIDLPEPAAPEPAPKRDPKAPPRLR